MQHTGTSIYTVAHAKDEMTMTGHWGIWTNTSHARCRSVTCSAMRWGARVLWKINWPILEPVSNYINKHVPFAQRICPSRKARGGKAWRLTAGIAVHIEMESDRLQEWMTVPDSDGEITLVFFSPMPPPQPEVCLLFWTAVEMGKKSEEYREGVVWARQ
jgi:hypothetical protein